MGSLRDGIIRRLEQVVEQYYRLVLVVAAAGGGKTAALQEVSERIGAPLINVNLELSRRMLELTERQRALRLLKLLSDIVVEAGSDVVLLDNIEILFDVSLKQDPLRLLQRLSRSKTVVAAWNGSIVDGYLTYAVPSHPEYCRYEIRDFLVVSPEVTA